MAMVNTVCVKDSSRFKKHSRDTSSFTLIYECGKQRKINNGGGLRTTFQEDNAAGVLKSSCPSYFDSDGVYISAERAQHVALLKKRFASIIYKANHRDRKIDPKKLEQVNKESELERKRQAAAELRKKREAAAEWERKSEADAELKRMREAAAELVRKREAAAELIKRRESERKALEEIERTVEIEDNYAVLKYMEDVCGPGYLIGY